MFKTLVLTVVGFFCLPVMAGNWVPANQVPSVSAVRVIINDASYGTMYKVCDATRYVQQGCRMGECSFEVSNNMCGDPAQGKRKTLTVNYNCAVYRGGQWYVDTDQREAYAFEHQRIDITCAEMQSVQ